MSSSGQAEEHFCAAVLDTSFHYGAGRRSSGPSGLKWRCSKPVTLSYTTQINIIISKRSIRNAIFPRDETCHITVLFEDTASVLSLCQNKSYKWIHFVLCGLFSLSNNYKDTFSTRQRFRIESQCLWIRNPSCQLVDMHLVATSQSTAEWLTIEIIRSYIITLLLQIAETIERSPRETARPVWSFVGDASPPFVSCNVQEGERWVKCKGPRELWGLKSIPIIVYHWWEASPNGTVPGHMQ